MKLTRIENFET